MEYERLRDGLAEPKSLWNTVQDWRNTADFDWPELTDEEVDGWRDRRSPKGILMGRLTYLPDSNILSESTKACLTRLNFFTLT